MAKKKARFNFSEYKSEVVFSNGKTFVCTKGMNCLVDESDECLPIVNSSDFSLEWIREEMEEFIIENNIKDDTKSAIIELNIFLQIKTEQVYKDYKNK